MRAIDADKLCEDLLTRWSIADEKQEQAVREIMANVVTPIVVSQPTITADRPRGEWIDGMCSLCGEHAPYWAMATTYHETNFCPNCGADMRKENSNEVDTM